MTEGKRNACPNCGSIRVKKRSNTNYYKCCKCGWVGTAIKKIMWFFGIPYTGGSPPVGRTRVNNVRERSFCPSCNSVRIRKRVNTHDYYCENCKWIGTSPKKMKWGTTTIC